MILHSASEQTHHNEKVDVNNTVNPQMSNVTNITIGNVSQEAANQIVAYASNVASSFASSVTTTIQETVTNITTKIKTTTYNCIETSKGAADSFAEYVKNNKIKLSFYALLGSYAYLHYKMLSTAYALNKDTNWSCWYKSTPLEELFTIPQKQLGEMIIKEAQRRYTDIKNPEDFVTPLIMFVHDVDGEHGLLNLYMTLSLWIRRLHLSKICWINVQLEACCKERLQRLAYIKNVFLTWIAEHKFSQYASAGA